MKQKLFNVLKPMVADKGLSKEEIESLADIYAKNLTDTSTDDEINDVANSILPVVELMQKSGNRMATSVTNKFKGYVDPKTLEKYDEFVKSQQTPPPSPDPTKPDTPPAMTAEAIQKLIAEQVSEGIAQGLKPFQEQQQAQQLRSMLNSHDKVKNIPDAFRARYDIKSADDLESVASQIESDYASIKQELIRSGEFQQVPTKGSEDTIDDDIQALKDMVASEQQK